MGEASNRAAKAAHKPSPMVRMMGLETAAGVLGQAALAAAMSIEPRSLRAKLTSDRGITDADLISAAAALDDRAAKIMAHAAKLRAEAGVA